MLIIRGMVKKGRGVGKKLGFPTLNIEYTGNESGVYAGNVMINGLMYKAAIHLGPKPTVQDPKPICEAFLLETEFLPEIEEEVRVYLYDKIRDIKEFPSLEALKMQIIRDVEQIKNLLK